MTDVRTLIPEKIFVGLRDHATHEYPGGHITSWGTDTGSINRMKTVTGFSSKTWEMDNDPQPGFCLLGPSYKDEIWVADPRGFSVSVKSFTLLNLFRECVVVNGMIQAPCVWSRTSAGAMQLLAVGSESHKVAVIQTRLAHSKVAVKNVQLGDWITLPNGTQGVYLGKYHRVQVRTGTYTREEKMCVDDTARLVLWNPQIKRNYQDKTQSLLFTSSGVIAAHEKHQDVFTPAQAEQRVNELIRDKTCDVISNSRNDYNHHTIMATKKAIQLKDIEIKPEPIQCVSEKEVYEWNHRVFYSTDQKDFWLWSKSYIGSKTEKFCQLDATELQKHRFSFVIDHASKYNKCKDQYLAPQTVLNNLYVLNVHVTSSLDNHLCMPI